MILRDSETYEAIRRDDLGYLMCTRYESVLEFVVTLDTPELLRCDASPLMVAAYFGSVKCFSFLYKKGNVDYTVPKTGVCLVLTVPCLSLRSCRW